MILDYMVVNFFKRTEPLYIHLAVTNAEKHPISVRVFGVKIHDGIDRMSVYILKEQT